MAEGPHFHVDNVFYALGPKGRYQIFQFLLATLGVFPATYQLLDTIFIGGDVPHRCAAPANESWLVKDNDGTNVTVSYEECNIILSSNNSVLTKHSCIAGMEYDYPISMSAKSQFDLVCSKAALYSLTQTLVFAGQGVGALIGPTISDRHGRKKVVVVSNFLFIAVGMAIAFSPNYIVFAIFRFLAGALQQSLFMTVTICQIELLLTKDRRLSAMLGGMSWGFGVMTMTGISYLFKGVSWRYLHMTLTLSSLLAFFQLWLMDESLRWLVANGKTKKALACIRKAAKMNKKDFDTVVKAGTVDGPDLQKAVNQEICVHQGNGELVSEKLIADTPLVGQEKQAMNGGGASDCIQQAKARKMNMLDLLRVRRLFINAVAMWFAWFTVSLSYFTLYLTATSLSGDKYLNMFLMSAMELPACVLFYFSYNRIGRRTTTIVLFAVLGIGLFAVGLFKHFSSSEGDVFSILTLLASLVALIGASGAFFSVFFYLPELFPTNLRNQALGMASFMARIGAMLAPFTGVLADVAIWAPGLLMGVCATITTMLLLLLPETKDKTLPQTLEELQKWQQKNGSEPAAEVKSLKNDTTC